MVARLSAALLLVLFCARGVLAIDAPAASVAQPPLPARIDGVEIQQIRGWFANIYPWRYQPEISTVFPVRSLWGQTARAAAAGLRPQLSNRH